MEDYFRETNLFSSVNAIIDWLDTHPQEWCQGSVVLECYVSEYTYCKIYTAEGMLCYMLATTDRVYHPSLWEKFKISRAIKRYSKYIAEELLKLEKEKP